MDFIIENDILKHYIGNDTEVIIPDGVTSIGDFAFFCHGHLTSITIPDSVTSIGIHTFSDCTSLTSITIPNSVTSIDKGAFYVCENLTSIIISDSITWIGDRAFDGCESLKSIIINGNELKINYKEIMNTGESITCVLDMLLTKDFSCKLSHKCKFKLIADYFFCSDDEDAKAYLKKNALKMIRQFIENNDIERINKLLEKTGFVTKRNIEKLLTYAQDNGQQKIYDILNYYKENNLK